MKWSVIFICTFICLSVYSIEANWRNPYALKRNTMRVMRKTMTTMRMMTMTKKATMKTKKTMNKFLQRMVRMLHMLVEFHDIWTVEVRGYSLEKITCWSQFWEHSPPTNVSWVQLCIWRHSWDEFVGSRLCLERLLVLRFSPGTTVFPQVLRGFFPGYYGFPLSRSSLLRLQVLLQPCLVFRSFWSLPSK